MGTFIRAGKEIPQLARWCQRLVYLKNKVLGKPHPNLGIRWWRRDCLHRFSVRAWRIVRSYRDHWLAQGEHRSYHYSFKGRKGSVNENPWGLRLLVWEWLHALRSEPLSFLNERRKVPGKLPCQLHRWRSWPNQRMVLLFECYLWSY